MPTFVLVISIVAPHEFDRGAKMRPPFNDFDVARFILAILFGILRAVYFNMHDNDGVKWT
jgi:hypothetical protein